MMKDASTLIDELHKHIGELEKKNKELAIEIEQLWKALISHCSCRFNRDSGEQYEECHLHKCQRSVCENGDPTDVTLLQHIKELEQQIKYYKSISFWGDIN